MFVVGGEVAPGVAWGASGLAMGGMVFDAIRREDRPSVLAIYSCGHAVALVLGSLIGAAVLQLMHESHAAYLTLFGLSSLMRLATLALLYRAPRAHTPQ